MVVAAPSTKPRNTIYKCNNTFFANTSIDTVSPSNRATTVTVGAGKTTSIPVVQNRNQNTDNNKQQQVVVVDSAPIAISIAAVLVAAIVAGTISLPRCRVRKRAEVDLGAWQEGDETPISSDGQSGEDDHTNLL